MEKDQRSRSSAVPRRRASRLAKLGGLATSIAGNVVVEGTKKLASGERPKLNDLLLTPRNATRVADELSKLRGAAMKLGQLISMDAGDVVPPEIADLLVKLRASAHAMPPRQLRRVLNENWGTDWLKKFARFDVNPIAAASIGQVHRAKTKDGRDLAIKVQYPGVDESIDSDVDNVAALIGVSGILPKQIDLKPLLEQAKAQLHDEADYEKEAAFLKRYGELLENTDDFLVPRLHEDLTTRTVLAMDYVSGVPIESLEDAAQDERDRIVSLMIDLMFRELFEFRLIQTDPNFANYLYDRGTNRIVLLDFGATKELSNDQSAAYLEVMRAGLAKDDEAIKRAGLALGMFEETVSDEHLTLLMEIIHTTFEPFHQSEPYDFGATDIAERIREQGVTLRRDAGFWHIPPVDSLFTHRKFGGIYLLASRLKARVDVAGLLKRYLTATR